MTELTFNSYIDHTNLSSDASAQDIAQLCEEALTHRFAAVCVSPVWVALASEYLKDSDVAVCTVIGFPTGAHVPEAKACEAVKAFQDGATELDMVINIAALKAGDLEAIRTDIAPLAKIAHSGGAKLKVILETALLSDEEIVRGCQWAEEFGADYVKTSTGMLKGENTGATVADVALMRESVGPDVGVKASGGVRDKETALAMIEAGATRIGTSSSVAIVS